MALLTLDGIHTYYEESHILQGISLSVESGGVVTILGRNGAGKTTTLRSVMGLTPPRRGRITFRGNEITGESPEQISQAGISLVPEDREVFTSLSVRDNLTLGGLAHDATQDRLDQVCSYFPRLGDRLTQKAGKLSGGEQQMLAIGRGLMADPEVLMLDEPSEGLAPSIVEVVIDIVDEINRDGVTVLLVEQNLEVALELGDHHHVLENGRIVFSGDNTELLKRPEFVREKLGTQVGGSA